MTDDLPPNPALLPAGLRDLLPPDAEAEAACESALMAAIAAHGYRRVKPPLLEFEDTLLAGSGAAMSEQTFRLMDPQTQRMMGLRADMTPQVARIATTRLEGAARPLRLSYAGQCIHVRGAGLAAERQVAQSGLELIGADTPSADAEIILVAADALAAVGLTRVSFDLTLPTLAAILLDHAAITGQQRAQLLHALDRKDAAAVTQHAGPLAGTLTQLLLAAGRADAALAALQGADLPHAARGLADRLAAVISAVRAQQPDLRLTVDPLEFRGFRYHTGVSVTVYAPGRAEELGRGGRYICGTAEPATGLTLFPDALLRAAVAPAPRARLYIPFAEPRTFASLAALRAEGWATVAGLEPDADLAAAARHLDCTHILRAGQPVALET